MVIHAPFASFCETLDFYRTINVDTSNYHKYKSRCQFKPQKNLAPFHNICYFAMLAKMVVSIGMLFIEGVLRSRYDYICKES